MKTAKIIYGDGTTETRQFKNSEWHAAREYAFSQARSKNTIVRGFTWID